MDYKISVRKYPFSEKLGHGGEDVEVAYRIIKSGFYMQSSLILQNSRELLQVAQQVRNLFIMD